MARFSTRQFSHTNGEVSPLVFDRQDMQFYYAALALCENLIPDHKGNLHRRPPTRYISSSKNGEKTCYYRLVAGADCPVIIIASPDCFRFILARAVVLDGGAPLELPHSYGEDYCELEFTEDCGAIVIAHENHPKRLLRKQASTFTLEQFENQPFGEINNDADCTLQFGNSSGTSGTIRSLDCNVGDVVTTQEGVTFNVTSVNGGGVCGVSFPSGANAGTYTLGDGTEIELTTTAATATLTNCSLFTPEMVGAQLRILNEVGNDAWVTATIIQYLSPTQVRIDYGGTSIAATDLFQLPAFGDGVYPETVYISNDRLWCAKENCVSASEVGNFDAWEPTDPDTTVNPDNAIYKKIGAGQCSDVRWFATHGRHLLLGTSDGLYSLVGAGASGAFQADAVAEARAQRRGSADIRPIEMDESVFFVDRSREKIFGTIYGGQYDQISIQEFTLFADHIGRKKFKKIAYQQSPYSIIWAITEDNCLFSLTVDVTQNVRGWARHRLGGQLIKNGCCTKPEVCDVEVVPSPNEGFDDVFLTVKRTINGEDVFFHEVITDFFHPNDHVWDYGHVDAHLPLANVSDGSGFPIGNGPAGFGAPLPGNFSVWDGEDWYRYETVGDESTLHITPAETPFRPGQDWVLRNGEWELIPKPSYCTDPEFVSYNECVVRSPCGVQKVAQHVDNVSGLDHLEGESAIVYADGVMSEEVVTSGSVAFNGSVGRVGLPYDSTFFLLPYRVNLGASDGFDDPSKTVRVAISVIKAFWIETGTGKHSELNRMLEEWQTLHAGEVVTGVVGKPYSMNTNRNEESCVGFRMRGPFPGIFRSVEAIKEASGGE